MAEANRESVDCRLCKNPNRLSPFNLEAWQAWSVLDFYGRDFDSMAGNPFPLRLEAITAECARHSDPESMRWRIMLIDRMVVKARHEKMEKTRKNHVAQS